jgi:hypothetical protein
MGTETETVTVCRADLDILVAACTSYLPAGVSLEVLDAFERMMKVFDEAHGVEGEMPGDGAQPDLAPGGEWAIVELLGHRERRGYVTQVERFGTPLLHIDLPAKLWDGDAGAWEEYAGAALYGMHPTTPAEVRAQWEREKERDRKQREWREQEAARWAALPAGRGEDSDRDEDLGDDDPEGTRF